MILFVSRSCYILSFCFSKETSDQNLKIELSYESMSDPDEENTNSDIVYMKQALHFSKETLNRREVPIACLIVYRDEVIARGSNDVNRTKNATRHAEFLAIEEVRTFCREKELDSSHVFKDCTLYVTTEPCVMCAAALRLVGLTDVVYGCGNQRFGGCGSRLDVHSKVPKKPNTNSPDSKRPKLEEIHSGCLTDLGKCLDCRSGIMAEEAVDVLKLFYSGENPNAPNPKDKTGRRLAYLKGKEK